MVNKFISDKTHTNYSVGDFLTRVKNAAMAKNKNVSTAADKQVVAVAEAMKKLGFLDEVKKDKGTLSVSLTFKNKKPLLMNIKLVSKPGLRIYMDVSDIEKKRGPSTYLITTPKGVISSRQAIKERVGGEVIAEIS
jgi:small subunit ribosomal protein S8